MTRLHVVGAAIARGALCLVARRGPAMSLPGKWEFPGGKVEPGEQAVDALAREIAEELGLEIEVGARLGTGSAVAGSRQIALDVYAATITSGYVAPREHSELAWASADELPHFDWAEADVPCVAPVAAWLRSRAQP